MNYSPITSNWSIIHVCIQIDFPLIYSTIVNQVQNSDLITLQLCSLTFLELSLARSCKQLEFQQPVFPQDLILPSRFLCYANECVGSKETNIQLVTLHATCYLDLECIYVCLNC